MFPKKESIANTVLIAMPSRTINFLSQFVKVSRSDAPEHQASDRLPKAAWTTGLVIFLVLIGPVIVGARSHKSCEPKLNPFCMFKNKTKQSQIS